MDRTNLIMNLQRSRKMRVWDSGKEAMIYDPYRVEDDGGWIYYATHEDFVAGNYEMCIPMDWTGTPDKNGVDIYEGDICELKNIELGDVIFQRFVVTFLDGCYFADDGDFGKILLFTVLKDYSCKVIGNIFENSELIEE